MLPTTESPGRCANETAHGWDGCTIYFVPLVTTFKQILFGRLPVGGLATAVILSTVVVSEAPIHIVQPFEVRAEFCLSNKNTWTLHPAPIGTISDGISLCR